MYAGIVVLAIPNNNAGVDAPNTIAVSECSKRSNNDKKMADEIANRTIAIGIQRLIRSNGIVWTF